VSRRRSLGALGVGCVAVTAAVVGAVLIHSPAASAKDARVLVELRPTSACDAVGVLRKAGATTVSATLRLYSLDSRSASQVLPRIRACKALRLTAPDRPAGTLSATDFTDPLVPSEWWRAAIGVADLTPPAAGKPVTIIDSGVDVAHPEFVGWPDLVMLNAQEPQPFGGVHGTAVASLIGATENGVGIVGVYPQALVQSWDSAIGAGTQLDTSEIVKGVLAAAAGGPGVINLSLGGNSFEVVIQQAIATAISKGLLVVAAAGNDGDAGNPLTYPSSLPHVLTVAATDEQNQVPFFSSQSRFVDLAAPGQDMMVASALDASWQQEDGTSFSSPLVAGAADWVWTVRPDLDASQLFEVMRRSATDIGAPGRDDASGYGLLNIRAALAYPAPVRDPFEPNDDIAYVRPGGMYYNGIPSLTTRAKPSATLTARLTIVEDPRDLYPVYVPAKGRITVKTASASSTDLTLWARSTSAVAEPSPGKDRLARGVTKGANETVTYLNPGAAKTVFLAVTLGKGTRDATYKVAVTAR
jgi:hypothetical protein